MAMLRMISKSKQVFYFMHTAISISITAWIFVFLLVDTTTIEIHVIAKAHLFIEVLQTILPLPYSANNEEASNKQNDLPKIKQEYQISKDSEPSKNAELDLSKLQVEKRIDETESQGTLIHLTTFIPSKPSKKQELRFYKWRISRSPNPLLTQKVQNISKWDSFKGAKWR